MPATGRVELRGRRVLVGLPGLGWRGDLRADERVVQGSRTYVPVIPEHEWYRAEAEQVEVFAPLVPVERVWVETVGSPASAVGANPGHGYPAGLPGRADAPRPRPRCSRPTRSPADEWCTSRTPCEHRDLRAVTETYSGADGDICVRVTPELEWYRWAWRGQPPTTLEVPVHLLWIE